MGFDYGVCHQGISALYKADNAIWGQLALPDTNHFVMHPGLLDSALQATFGLSLTGEPQVDKQTGTALPFALGAIHIYRPLPANAWVWGRYSQGSTPDDAVRKLDITVCDEQGQVCVELLGFSSRILSEAPNAPTASELLLFTPQWQTTQAEPAADANLPSWQIWLLGGFDEKRQANIQKALPQGASCMLLGEPGNYAQTAEQVFAKLKQVLSDASLKAQRIQVVIDSSNGDREFAGLSAMLKTAQQENPKLSLQCIEFTAPVATVSLVNLLSADAKDFTCQEICYGGGESPQRQVKRWHELTVEAKQASVWNPEGVYLHHRRFGRSWLYLCL